MPRLLLVDGSAPVRAMLRTAAERAGWSVAEAADARSALRAFAEWRPDAVLLDLLLPSSPDGLAVLRRMRDFDSAATVILATAWPGRAMLAETQRLGAAAIFLKPFDPGAVLRALEIRAKSDQSASAVPILIALPQFPTSLQAT